MREVAGCSTLGKGGGREWTPFTVVSDLLKVRCYIHSLTTLAGLLLLFCYYFGPRAFDLQRYAFWFVFCARRFSFRLVHTWWFKTSAMAFLSIASVLFFNNHFWLGPKMPPNDTFLSTNEYQHKADLWWQRWSTAPTLLETIFQEKPWSTLWRGKGIASVYLKDRVNNCRRVPPRTFNKIWEQEIKNFFDSHTCSFYGITPVSSN